MRIVCISDTHEQHDKLTLPPGDVLVHAGDMTGMGTSNALKKAASWLRNQPHLHKVAIPGNHDWGIFNKPRMYQRKVFTGVNLLINSEVTIDGVRFWGNPWTPEFFNWAYNATESHLAALWHNAPAADVIVTHGPPRGVGDLCPDGRHAGCWGLLRYIKEHHPRLVICGHIHEGYGIYQLDQTTIVNASVLDGSYKHTNAPVVIDL